MAKMVKKWQTMLKGKKDRKRREKMATKKVVKICQNWLKVAENGQKEAEMAKHMDNSDQELPNVAKKRGQKQPKVTKPWQKKMVKSG